MTGEASRRVALDALERIEDGAFAHILVPDLLRKASLDAARSGFRHRARLRHSPHATRGRLLARVGGIPAVGIARAARACRPPARCVSTARRYTRPRRSRGDGERRERAPARVRQRQLARAFAPRTAVAVAHGPRSRIGRDPHVAPGLDREDVRRRIRRRRCDRDTRTRRRAAAGDVACESNAHRPADSCGRTPRTRTSK